jgi:hypothetical protein
VDSAAVGGGRRSGELRRVDRRRRENEDEEERKIISHIYGIKVKNSSSPLSATLIARMKLHFRSQSIPGKWKILKFPSFVASPRLCLTRT